MWTEHTSTAVRMAAAGVGVCAVPAHLVRGVVGEDCVVLSPDPVWKRPLTVYARVPLTGAAEAFVHLLCAMWPSLAAAPTAATAFTAAIAPTDAPTTAATAFVATEVTASPDARDAIASVASLATAAREAVAPSAG